MQYEYQSAKTSDYEVKQSKEQYAGYDAYEFQQQIAEQNREKLEKFKARLNEFNNVGDLKEAKELAERIMPVKNEHTVFWIGDAKCIIISSEQMLRISLESPKEFISYDFV